MNCKLSKCKAECCYNVPMPKGYEIRFHNLIANPIKSTTDLGEGMVIHFTDIDLNNNKCPFLNAQFRCNIYEERPEICRKFGDGSHPYLTCIYLK